MKISGRKEILGLLNEFFGVKADEYESSYIWTLVNSTFQDFIVVTLSSDFQNNEEGIILNVQTSQGVFELHACRDYKIIEADEIFFWVEEVDSISLMIIGKQATCSMFSNINKRVLNKEITELSPNEVLAAVQVSMIFNQ